MGCCFIYAFRAFSWLLPLTLKSRLSENFGFALLTRKISVCLESPPVAADSATRTAVLPACSCLMSPPAGLPRSPFGDRSLLFTGLCRFTVKDAALALKPLKNLCCKLMSTGKQQDLP